MAHGSAPSAPAALSNELRPKRLPRSSGTALKRRVGAELGFGCCSDPAASSDAMLRPKPLAATAACSSVRG